WEAFGQVTCTVDEFASTLRCSPCPPSTSARKGPGTSSPMISALTTPLISSAAMRGIFEDRARLGRMLDFEVALARTQAALGVIPTLATDKIVHAARPERYDFARLAEDATSTGDIGITLINALAAEVAKSDPEAASYVHWGAAGKDLI